MLSLFGIVASRSLEIAGVELDKHIMSYLMEENGILVGDKTAEELKINLGSAYPVELPLEEMKVRGRDLITGLPKEITVTVEQIREAIRRPLGTIVDTLKGVLESTPPELVADIAERGIILTGGGALLPGIDRVIQDALRIPVKVADDPLTCVVRGTGIII